MADLAKYPRWSNDTPDVNQHVSGIQNELWERFNLYRNDVRGSTGIAIGVTSGYRSNAEQKYLYDCYQGKLRTGRCACGSCNLAAPPGSSNHNRGLAIDQNPNFDASPRIVEAARRWGLWFPVPSEHWHIEMISTRQPNYKMPPLPAAPQPGEDPMANPFVGRKTGDPKHGEIAIFYPGTPFRVPLRSDDDVRRALTKPPFGMGLTSAEIDPWFFANTEPVDAHELA